MNDERTHLLLEGMTKKLTEINQNLLWQSLGDNKIHTFYYEDTEIKFYLPLGRTDAIQKGILANSSFFENKILNSIRGYITSDSTVLDAGANIGNHTVYFSCICGSRDVIAVEPLNFTHSILMKNIEINKMTGVRPIKAALGSREGAANLFAYAPRNIGASSLIIKDTGKYKVITIDSLRIQKLDFIKMDVEGFHLEALKGAKETLERCSPLIMIELRERPDEFTEGEIFLRSIGYSIKDKLSKTDYIFEKSS